MLTFLMQNISTVIVSLLLIGIVTLIIVGMVKDKKKGKCSGSCAGCSGCGNGHSCNKNT